MNIKVKALDCLRAQVRQSISVAEAVFAENNNMDRQPLDAAISWLDGRCTLSHAIAVSLGFVASDARSVAIKNPIDLICRHVLNISSNAPVYLWDESLTADEVARGWRLSITHPVVNGGGVSLDFSRVEVRARNGKIMRQGRSWACTTPPHESANA